MTDEAAPVRLLLAGAAAALISAGLGFALGRASAIPAAPSPLHASEPAPEQTPKPKKTMGRKARAKAARHEHASEEIKRLDKQIQSTNSADQKFQLQLRKIDALQRGERLEEAYAELERIRTDENRPAHQWKHAHSRQMALLHRMRNTEKRLKELGTSTPEKLNDRDLFMLADLQGLQGQADAQIKSLQMLRQRDPSDSEIQHKLVSVLMRANRLGESEAALAELRSQKDLMFPHRAYDLARYCKKSGKADILPKLASQVEAFATAGNNSSQSWSIASRIYALAGDVDNANRALDRWAQGTGRPRDLERAKVRRVEVLLNAGRMRDAALLLPETEKVLHVKENVAFARNLRRRLGLPVEIKPNTQPK